MLIKLLSMKSSARCRNVLAGLTVGEVTLPSELGLVVVVGVDIVVSDAPIIDDSIGVVAEIILFSECARLLP